MFAIGETADKIPGKKIILMRKNLIFRIGYWFQTEKQSPVNSWTPHQSSFIFAEESKLRLQGDLQVSDKERQAQNEATFKVIFCFVLAIE
jgi:hypothetical protein